MNSCRRSWPCASLVHADNPFGGRRGPRVGGFSTANCGFAEGSFWPRLRFRLHKSCSTVSLRLAGRLSVAAGASALVLLEQDGAKFRKVVRPVGEEPEDRLTVICLQPDFRTLVTPGLLQLACAVEFAGISKAGSELKDSRVRYGDTSEIHALDFDRFGQA